MKLWAKDKLHCNELESQLVVDHFFAVSCYSEEDVSLAIHQNTVNKDDLLKTVGQSLNKRILNAFITSSQNKVSKALL
jgi:hypothetical protein